VPFLPGEQLFPARLRLPSEPGCSPASLIAAGEAAASLAADRGSLAATGPAPPERDGTAMNHPDTTAHQAQRAEELVSFTGRERLRFLWYRLRLTISEMNYATRRMVELQAPWISDSHPR
jgi:hypothetical protein